MKVLRTTSGYTLVELILVMAIFMTIMIVTSAGFESIGKHTSQQGKLTETLTESVVGLEVLRSDLKQAGFGLPWSFPASPAVTGYTECQVTSTSVPAAGFWPSGVAPSGPASFNDAPGAAPRAVVIADTSFNKGSTGPGSQYLVVKSMLVAGGPQNRAAQKWTNVAYANGGHTKTVWGDTNRDLLATDRVAVVKNSLNSNPATQQLMLNATGSFSTTFSNYTTLITSHKDGDTYEIYGLDGSNATMPFNRADYYVRTPAVMPSDCAPATGTLYKATLQQGSGSFIETPLLDCVADMQVVFGLDTNSAGFINSHVTTLPTTAQLTRDQLREIRVYLLTHEGKRDTGYTYPSRYVTVGEAFGGVVQGRVFDLQTLIGSGWDKYRWKVHSIVVRPRNLSQ